LSEQTLVKGTIAIHGRTAVKIVMGFTGGVGEGAFTATETQYYTGGLGGLQWHGDRGVDDRGWGYYDTYSSGLTDLPARVHVGQTFRSTAVNHGGYTSGTKKGHTWSAPAIQTGTVNGWQTISVPAGTFKCLKVTVRLSERYGTRVETVTRTIWYAKGKGIVRMTRSDSGGSSLAVKATAIHIA
jgi:hypothetical protein